MTDYTDLARRAVACTHWRWVPGMLTSCRVRVTEGGADYLIGHKSGATRDGGGWVDTGDSAGFLPDLDDPATIGCLLALVREAWGDPSVSCTMTFGGWWRVLVMLPDRLVRHYHGPTEAAALVAALEAAPC